MIATNAELASNARTCIARYGELHARGLSRRQAAKVLAVPRTPLQAWRTGQDGKLIASDIQEPIDTRRTIAQQEASTTRAGSVSVKQNA